MKTISFLRMLPALAAGGILLFLTAACGSDEPDSGKDDIRNRVYQQYEVRITDGSPIAYANLRRASASGDRVHLSGASSLSANGTEMYYTVPSSPDIPEFTYTLPLEPDATSVTFSLQVTSDFSLRNTIRFSAIPEVELTLTDNTLSPSSPLRIDMTTVSPGELTVLLSPSPMADPTLGVKGSVSAAGIVVFPELPTPGQYYLTVSATRVIPTSENDGVASGSITGVRTVTRRITVGE